ncbi:MAG: hypothetical protein LBV52_04255 [Spirochaetaceae bacterium]|jgi:hypothetical protein|nr:hypothetical protein [Spirochaetaceae bacterium]
MIFKTKILCFLCAAALVSCSDETSINKMLGISAQAPVITGCKVVSGKQVVFSFSTPVTIVSANFVPPLEVESTTGGTEAAVNFTNDTSGGRQFIADILVEDADGNTLNALVPFRTRNDNVPQFEINEVRIDATKPKSEFIEIKTKTAGNLGAVRVFAASTSIEEPFYEFPCVEVAAGEYIILHLRTYPEQQNCIDELENRLDLARLSGSSSAANDTPTTARDIFVPDNKKILHKSDVIYLLDQDDKILDAVMFSELASSWGKTKALTQAAEFLAKQGAWLSRDGVSIKTPAFEDAAVSAGTTTTKTLCRYEAQSDSNTASDWYVCPTSKASPGLRNNLP